VIIIFFISLKFPVGGNHLQYTQLLCSTLAKGLASFALLHFFRKNYYLTFILLGIATLFQLLVGLQLFIVIVLYCIIVSNKSILTIIQYVFLYLITSAYILFPVIYQYLTQTSSTGSQLFYDVLFNIRNPEHYRIEATPVLHLLAFLCFYILGMIILLRSSVNHKKTILFFITITTFFCFIQFISIRIEALHFLVAAQWYKSTIWIIALLSCVITIALTADRRPDNRFEVLGFRFQSKLSNVNYQLSILIVLIAFVLFNSKKVPIAQIQGKYQIGNYQKSDLTLMHEWIFDHTPKDAVIISFPSDHSLLCEAKRSMPIEFRAMIHDKQYMNEWMNEVKNIYQVDLLNNKDPMLDHLEQLYNSDGQIPYQSSVKIDYKLVDRLKYKVQIANNKVIHKQGSYWLLALSY
jgi:hypothetical protein